MRCAAAPIRWLPLVAAWAGAWPLGAAAQVFSADYRLARLRAEVPWDPNLRDAAQDAVRLSPILRSDASFTGAGLSMEAGRNWFAQAAVGRSLSHRFSPIGEASAGAFSVAGGYRWSDGQVLSLQLTGAPAAGRLGLSLSYGWPRYFVRLTYGNGLHPAPQDNLRFSAGLRF